MDKNVWLGRHHTIEARAKMSVAKKGQIPWNKGRKATPEECKKNSVGHLGQISWRKGERGVRHHTDETRKRMSRNLIGNTHCVGHKASEKTKKKMSVAKQGSKHPNWKGGITPIGCAIKNNVKYLKWRQDCFIRDGFTCQKCGDNRGGNLNVHHKKPFIKLLTEAIKCLPLFSPYEAAMIYTPIWNLNNGVTLCEKCHRKIKRKRIGGT